MARERRDRGDAGAGILSFGNLVLDHVTSKWGTLVLLALSEGEPLRLEFQSFIAAVDASLASNEYAKLPEPATLLLMVPAFQGTRSSCCA